MDGTVVPIRLEAVATTWAAGDEPPTSLWTGLKIGKGYEPDRFKNGGLMTCLVIGMGRVEKVFL